MASRLTVRRCRPASRSDWAFLASSEPLVVSVISTGRPSGRRRQLSWAIRVSRSRRSRGSPPVRRILRTPSSTNSRAMRVISSKLSSEPCERNSWSLPKTSRGMQYEHRKLQRSVTEMRRSCSGRPRASVTASPARRSSGMLLAIRAGCMGTTARIRWSWMGMTRSAMGNKGQFCWKRTGTGGAPSATCRVIAGSVAGACPDGRARYDWLAPGPGLPGRVRNRNLPGQTVLPGGCLTARQPVCRPASLPAAAVRPPPGAGACGYGADAVHWAVG